MKIYFIKRKHGLGNVIMLLPILIELDKNGYTVVLITKKEWCNVFSLIFPQIQFVTQSRHSCIDLDKYTFSSIPSMHRTKEFALILGVSSYSPSKFDIPQKWSQEFERYRNCIVIAPEANHQARSWPSNYTNSLCDLLVNNELVLVGLNKQTQNSRNTKDLRGELSLSQLMGLLSVCKHVIAVDSAILQISMALNKKCISIFSSINPNYRINPEQKVLTFQAGLSCCPCNKNETCDKEYNCIKSITPNIISDNIAYLNKISCHELKITDVSDLY